jgi:hypothetical protein
MSAKMTTCSTMQRFVLSTCIYLYAFAACGFDIVMSGAEVVKYDDILSVSNVTYNTYSSYWFAPSVFSQDVLCLPNGTWLIPYETTASKLLFSTIGLTAKCESE